MPGIWAQIFGGDVQMNRAERRAQEREIKRMVRKNQRAHARQQRMLEAFRSKEETDAQE